MVILGVKPVAGRCVWGVGGLKSKMIKEVLTWKKKNISKEKMCYPCGLDLGCDQEDPHPSSIRCMKSRMIIIWVHYEENIQGQTRHNITLFLSLDRGNVARLQIWHE